MIEKLIISIHLIFLDSHMIINSHMIKKESGRYVICLSISHSWCL